MIEEILGQGARCAEDAMGDVTRETVQIHGKHCGIEGRERLANQAGENSRQHISVATDRHTRIPGRVLEKVSSVGDDRSMPFEDDDRLRLESDGDGPFALSLSIPGGGTAQSGPFAGMGSQDSRA